MKNTDAITILRAAGMHEAVAMLEKVTAFKISSVFDLSTQITYNAMALTVVGNELVLVQHGHCVGGHPTEAEAVQCAKDSLPMIKVAARMQEQTDPNSRIIFAVVKTTPEIMQQFDLSEGGDDVPLQ